MCLPTNGDFKIKVSKTCPSPSDGVYQGPVLFPVQLAWALLCSKGFVYCPGGDILHCMETYHVNLYLSRIGCFQPFVSFKKKYFQIPRSFVQFALT